MAARQAMYCLEAVSSIVVPSAVPCDAVAGLLFLHIFN